MIVGSHGHVIAPRGPRRARRAGCWRARRTGACEATPLANVDGLLRTRARAAGAWAAPCDFGVLSRRLSSVLVAGGRRTELLLRDYYTRV